MSKRATASDDQTITVHIPLTFKKHGGRKRVVTPDGAEWAPRPRVDNAMVKAPARAFRWRRMLDEGVFGTLEDLARARACTRPTLAMRLTLLAPGIVEAILYGQQQAALQLNDLLEGFPLEWDAQGNHLPPVGDWPSNAARVANRQSCNATSRRCVGQDPILLPG